MNSSVWPEPLRQGDPRQAGAYQLEGRLGGGGMGQVFLGRSPGGRPVAVKLVRPELADDPGFRRRFVAEVEAARKVGGFYTAQVVDADPDADPPWLVTAYIPGPSLHEAVVTHGPLPAEAITLLGAGLAEGLRAIHARKLVHRDLKPSNVILAADGPRVIDFGITRALDATSHTLSRAVVGTPSFMSPEQARGQEVGPPSDVFSLGLVLAFAATGRSPFGTGPAEAIVYRIVHDEPDLTGLPAHLTDLVKRCLTKDPRDRPGVADILEELTSPTSTTTQWLPPPITTMIAERQVQTPPAPTPTNTQARHDGPPTDRDSVTPEQFSSSTATAAPATLLRATPTLREAQVTDGGRFEISWTGREPVTAYAPLNDMNVPRLWFSTLGLAAVSALLLYFTAAAGQMPEQGVDKSNSPWMMAFIPGILAGVLALLCLLLALIHTRHAVKDARVHRKRSGWSLSVGSDGITTTDAFRRTVTWEQIGQVSLRNIQAETRHRYTGLHVRFTDDAAVPKTRPAGWCDPEAAPYGKEGNVPLCVLGPMTEQQRFDLTNALIHHAGERWDAKAPGRPQPWREQVHAALVGLGYSGKDADAAVDAVAADLTGDEVPLVPAALKSAIRKLSRRS